MGSDLFFIKKVKKKLKKYIKWGPGSVLGRFGLQIRNLRENYVG